jgi:signal transduction histidine kinase
MSAALMRLELLGRRLTDPAEREALDRLEESIRQAIGRLRRLLFDLTPPALHREGLAPALRQLLERACSGTGVRWELRDGLRDEPPHDVRTVLYRVVQEALANACKHARASSVRVELEETSGRVLARVEDDGVGFSPAVDGQARPGHLGIASMRERAELAGGRLAIRSRAGEGTTVEVWVPTGAAVRRGERWVGSGS